VSLRDARVEPAVPVSDMAQAKEFYETKLGLSDGRQIFDGGITYPCGEGREIHIYPPPRTPASRAAPSPPGRSLTWRRRSMNSPPMESSSSITTVIGSRRTKRGSPSWARNGRLGSRTPTGTPTASSNFDRPRPGVSVSPDRVAWALQSIAAADSVRRAYRICR
jgi:catechol 2,3-dioxygenase-like lactoylglutathione lyase family enzyme